VAVGLALVPEVEIDGADSVAVRPFVLGTGNSARAAFGVGDPCVSSIGRASPESLVACGLGAEVRASLSVLAAPLREITP
jgi:hypothetical protein